MRNSERTRAAILAASRSAVTEHGAAASLDLIARAAGVSKGGLLHHFRSKDDLLLALTRDLYTRFEEQVDLALRGTPVGPTRLARAYIMAMFAELRSPGLAAHYGTLIPLLSEVPAIAEFTAAESRRWQESFMAEGAHMPTVRIAVLAADGAALASLHRPMPPEELSELEDSLLDLLKSHPKDHTA